MQKRERRFTALLLGCLALVSAAVTAWVCLKEQPGTVAAERFWITKNNAQTSTVVDNQKLAQDFCLVPGLERKALQILVENIDRAFRTRKDFPERVVMIGPTGEKSARHGEVSRERNKARQIVSDDGR